MSHSDTIESTLLCDAEADSTDVGREERLKSRGAGDDTGNLPSSANDVCALARFSTFFSDVAPQPEIVRLASVSARVETLIASFHRILLFGATRDAARY